MRSMTGFGKGEVVSPQGVVLTVEVSSVNRKQFEPRFSLPSEYAAREIDLRKRLGEVISRGAVSLRVVRSGAAGAASVNTALLEELARLCVDLRKRFGLAPEFDAAALLSAPGVMNGAAESGEDDGGLLTAALEKALEKFLAMRTAEGAALAADLRMRLDQLEGVLDEIEPRTAGIGEALRTRLLERIKAENLPADPNDERFLKEVLFYADRADVTEEITRLRSHFSQFRGFLAEPEKPVGRGMDFLVQEMFREITTLGNKAGTPEVSPLVVAFKTELEKIREQVQNVE